jgi:hypothetical protein
LAASPRLLPYCSLLSDRVRCQNAANLMLKRYGHKALEESAIRADEFAAAGDHEGAAIWRRITAAVEELANDLSSGPLH